ncbi:hypothetical protein Q5424_10210 [Conexibacter sp. JD483]|uniref:Eco57I restriction-modification methylase domain-containing protein n=1 Tax=unclassified Conexibacter TaxID=2627773 RepID=UPI002722199D|nr:MULTISPECIES: hypothetical protein [unclassified Conexibacter]MDO8188321.1 hypothetical protein [Conexibacter sp. CPCC 205706]MDO8200731.1 hypothetical protein [Conexibacter sp. CPCC 205762]MDR9369455.1 hypothetical protein [Conexibacter sp. JD483]
MAPTDGTDVDPKVRSSVIVAGATPLERLRLAALGGLARAVAGKHLGPVPFPVAAWMETAELPPADVQSAVIEALRRGEDPLAEAYNACISAANRRQLGTVFTPSEVVDHMLDLVVDNLYGRQPACVIDPGAGVGAFTVAAARRWHNARVIAVDINPVTLGLLAARIAYERSQDARWARRRIDLQLADYASALPGLFAADAPAPILALGNPPYTRTQSLTSGYKRDAERLRKVVEMTGHANLATVFQALTLEYLRADDLSCMVLPGSIVYTDAARGLRRAMWSSSRPVEIHRWRADTKPFVGRNVQAAVLMIGPERSVARPIRLARAESMNGNVELIQRWTMARDKPPPDNWFWAEDSFDQPDAVLPLTTFVTIRRGTATGANFFFFLTDSERAAFPDDVITPAVASLRRFEGTVMTQAAHRTWGGADEPRWLLTLDPYKPVPAPLVSYLAEHEDTVSRRHLSTQRREWWAITELPRPDILVSPLTQKTFKIVVNKAKAVASNNLLGLTLREGNPAPLAKWLRSIEGQRELRRVSRRYSGGSFKVEPGGLKRLQVPRSVVAAVIGRSPESLLTPELPL